VTKSVCKPCRWWVLGIWASVSSVFADEAEISKLDQEASFHIEKGPLESALIQFSRQADVQVLLAPDSAPNVTASAVKGRLAAGAALTALLKGTGLIYNVVGNTVTVQLSESKDTVTESAPRPKTTKIPNPRLPGAS
jgi:hypothetical protein